MFVYDEKANMEDIWNNLILFDEEDSLYLHV
jgi:hypothetical protein